MTRVSKTFLELSQIHTRAGRWLCEEHALTCGCAASKSRLRRGQLAELQRRSQGQCLEDTRHFVDAMSTVDARTDEERKNGYQNRDAEEDRETETGNGRGFMKERPEICWQEHHPEPCLSRPGSVDGRQICERSDAVISGKDPVYMRLWLKMDDSCNGSGLVRVYG